MISLKKVPKKLIAILLSLLLLITAIPVGLYTTVFAAANECLAVEIDSVIVYFYGVDSLEVENNKVKYIGGDDTVSAVLVNGSDEIDTADVVTDGRSVEFTNDWLSKQSGWIAVMCDSSIEKPVKKPNAQVDKEAPVIAADDITGVPTKWTKDNVTLTVNASDSGVGVVAYSLDKMKWQAENRFEISENNEYTFFAKDAVGNVSEGTSIIVDKIDKEAPSVPSIFINPESWTAGNIEVTVTASDNQSSVKYSDDCVNWDESGHFTVSENGKYTFYAIDEAGNISENSQIITNKDIYTPEIENVYVNYGDMNVADDAYISSNSKYTFKIAASDVGLGISKYGVSVGESDSIEWNDTGEFVLDGASKYVFYAVDGADLECTYTYEKKIDNDAPSAAVKLNTKLPTNKPITFTVTASDRENADLSYKCDNGEWRTSNVFKIEDSNEHTFYVKDDTIPANISEVKKQADNYYSPKDNKPKITQIKSSNENWTNEKITFTVDCEPGKPNKANKQAKISDFVIDPDLTAGNPVKDWGWINADQDKANQFVISDCKKHRFYVMDEANNISEAAVQTAGNFDSKKPVYHYAEFTQKNDNVFAELLNKLTFGRFFNKSLKIDVDVSDSSDENNNVSGIKQIELQFIDTENHLVKTFLSDENKFDAEKIGNTQISEQSFTFDDSKEPLPENFKGYAKIIVTDWAGNVNEESNQIVTTENSNLNEYYENDNTFMLENNAPVISKPETGVTALTSDGKPVSKNSYTLSFNVSDITQENYSGLAYLSVLVNPEFDDNGNLIPNTGAEVASKEVGGILNYQSDSKILPEQNYSITAIAASDNSDLAYTVNGVKINDEVWNNGQLKYVITACDNSGNVSAPAIVEAAFDQTAPTIKEFEIGGSTASKVDVEDYGFYFRENVSITISAEDIANKANKEAVASGVASITAFLRDKDGTIYIVPQNNSLIEKSKHKSFLDAPAIETKDSITFTVPRDFKGQIYALAADNAGNSPQIVNVNGEVIDASKLSGSANCVYFNEESADVNGFVHPDGSIVESSEKHTNTSHIIFEKVPTPSGTQNNSSNYSYKCEKIVQPDNEMDYVKNVANNKVPLYNRDVTFGVKVTDSYSGIREVSYTIIEGSETTVKTVQIDNDGNFADGNNEGWSINESTKDKNLVTEMTNNIAVSGNYNDMVLLIELTDRAGNKSYDYYVFGIDKTAPSIEVEYDNNAGDSQSGTGTYFKANRTATITVSERNFNKEDVNFIVKNAEGDAPAVKFVKDVKGNGNGDDTKHIFKVTYGNDGVYSFDMNYTDRAANKNSEIDYKNSLAPKSFVVDKTNPTISVSYDNNDAKNGKFFKAYRTATITIVEHNFDVQRVVIKQTAALSDKAISNPSVSWANKGDTHIGTIRYNADGDYTFDITMTDKAGNKEKIVNYSDSAAANDFTIDTTYSDIVKVEGIKDKGVLGLKNGDIKADAEIKITIHDVNLDNYNITLTRSRVLVAGESDDNLDVTQESVVDSPKKQCAENNIKVTSQFVKNSSGTKNATATISIPKKTKGVRNDGLYILTIEAKDKAGNAYDTKANTITFSVNRFGSVFTFSDDLYKLITDNDGYTKYSDRVQGKTLSVYEYNATSVKNESEKVEVIANNDSQNLTRDTNYTVSKDKKQTDTSWNKYTYNIKPENFEKDGVYTLRVSSKDAASITSQTVDYDVCSANFVVDNTTPSISAVNYSVEVNKVPMNEKWGSAKTDNLKVNFTVEDVMRLEKIEVKINGKTKDIYTYNKEFNDGNSFSGEFELPMGDNSFEIIATDKVDNSMSTLTGGSDGTEFEHGYVFFDNITVTTNLLVIWSKSPVFWGIIGVVAALAVGIVIFIVVKKRRKDDDEENA